MSHSTHPFVGIPTPIHTRPSSPLHEPYWMQAIDSYYLRPFVSKPPTQKESPKKKRIQCKAACIHCKKACKKCEDVRPCSRCVKMGLADQCLDVPRKPRSSGMKRGPYKRKYGHDFVEDDHEWKS